MGVKRGTWAFLVWLWVFHLLGGSENLQEEPVLLWWSTIQEVKQTIVVYLHVVIMQAFTQQATDTIEGCVPDRCFRISCFLTRNFLTSYVSTPRCLPTKIFLYQDKSLLMYFPFPDLDFYQDISLPRCFYTKIFPYQDVSQL